jgi:2-keto-4-pentenoate hydratase
MTPTHEDLALRLRNAYKLGAIAPMRDGLDPKDAQGAYAIQALNTRVWKNAGRRVVGRKIGLTAKTVQAQLGVDEPDFGVLFEDMVLEDGGELQSSQVIQPKAEAEVALVLGREMHNARAGLHDVIAATAYVVPAIEIVDSRIADWKITFADTVADNGSSAFLVLGKTPVALSGLDLETCGMVLEQNRRVTSIGVGAACLGHPLAAAAWLIRTLSAAGETLQAGDIILTGALGPMVSIRPADVVSARIGGLGACGFAYRESRS